MTSPYLNRALTNYRAEINARWPNRDKSSDGWIGDKAHQGTVSDHNPDPDGSVNALDVTVKGIDVNVALVAAIAHESTRYVIYNRRITSRDMAGGLGTWHPYSGTNPHDKHFHVSSRRSHANSSKPWFVSAPKPTPIDWTDSLIMAMSTVKRGSKGEDVKTWQGVLVARGFTVKVDGVFGQTTETATKGLQKKYGAAADGIVGRVTWTAGIARKLVK